ncbi:MAG: hypothetical protein H6658_03100 [Ardenticatenaceae bacterium]|nr:hypothetical protein [Ardenticatenaceae bacterium]
MNKVKPYLFLTLITLALLFIFTIFSKPATTEAAVNAAENSHFVKISATNDINRLNLSPLQEIDYQSFIWLELSDADYGKLASSDVNYADVPDAGTLQVMHYQFDPIVDGEPALAEEMKSSGSDAGFRLIQLVGPTKDSWLAD